MRDQHDPRGWTIRLRSVRMQQELPVQLLDFLQQYPGWTLDAGGRLWSVEEYVRHFQQLAGPADRGPEVIAHASIDLGAVTVVALDAAGSEQEPVGRLFPSIHRW